MNYWTGHPQDYLFVAIALVKYLVAEMPFEIYKHFESHSAGYEIGLLIYIMQLLKKNKTPKF